MIELVLVYCLAAAPDQCVERRLPFDPGISAMACTMEAQRVASEFLETHREWLLRGWRCEKDRPPQGAA
jgi:hypothetical protein